MNRINWLAILACVVVAMGIGFLWYGQLFQDQWMLGNGITMEGDNMFKNGKQVALSSTPMIVNTIVMLIFAFLINWLINISNQTTAIKGATVGVVIGVIVSLNTLTTNLFANNPMSLTFIDASYVIVLLGLMGAILGGWRKK